MLRDGEFVTDGATRFDQLVLIAACEYAFERGPKLATLRVGRVVCLELRFDSVNVDGSVVVVDEIVRPQDVGALRIVVRVGGLGARCVAQLSLREFSLVLCFDAQLGRRACDRWKVRSVHRGHGDVTATDIASTQSAPFRRNSELHSGTFRAREQCGAVIFSAVRKLSVGRSEGTTVRHLIGGLLGLARTVAVPVLPAAMAASPVLRRPCFLERVGSVVALRVAAFAIRLGILVLLGCVAFREKRASRLGAVDRAVFTSFQFRQNVTDCCERGRESASGG
eukprot:3823847-Pleurochrysis_carterae.AAC.1